MKVHEIITEAKVETSKPRNFVAKNAKIGGAGQHKDKKKAEKQGDVKHKAKQFDEESKGLYYNVNKRKKAGTSRDASSPKAPTAQAWRDAAKTAKKEGVAEGFDYTMKDLGNDYAGFPSNHSLKHKFLARIKPEKQQLYKDKMNNMHEFEQLSQLFKVAKQRGDIIDEGVADTVKQKAKQFSKYMTEPDTPQQAVVRDRAKNIDKIRKNKEQGVAEAGNKPLEKSRFGTGDTRTPRDIKSQMQGASDKFVKSTADSKTGPFHSKVAKMQGKMAKSELRRREQGVAETATAGSTSAGNVAVGAVYKNKKPKMQKPGTNALDMKGGNLMTGGSIKR